MIEIYLKSFQIGLIAYVMSINYRSGEVFGLIPKVIRKALFGSKKAVNIDTVPWWKYWIAKVSYACGKCQAGLFAAIYFALFYWMEITFLDYVFCVFGAIFTTYFINEKLEK